jgi:hypothetical protein
VQGVRNRRRRRAVCALAPGETHKSPPICVAFALACDDSRRDHASKEVLTGDQWQTSLNVATIQRSAHSQSDDAFVGIGVTIRNGEIGSWDLGRQAAEGKGR